MDKKRILEYLIKIIKIKSGIDFKKEKPLKLDESSNFENGFLGREIYEKLFQIYDEKNKQKKIKNTKEDDLKVLVLPKIIKSERLIDEMNKEGKICHETDVLDIPVLYIPAILDMNGQLKVNTTKTPWIPIEILAPFGNNVSIGEWKDKDFNLTEGISNKNEILWDKYIAKVKEYYKFQIENDWDSTFLKNSEKKNSYYEIYPSAWIILDETVEAYGKILELYHFLFEHIDENMKSVPLLNKLLFPSKDTEEGLYGELNIKSMKKHLGVMSGKWPLSPSQRESLHHLNETKDGEILAVSGPPGTGKTTLLQSVVADLFVKHAKEGLKAPIIVATSTNNKAVTNIMDSFANVVEEDSDKNEKRKLLERRWIGLSSFSVYFPSDAKKNDPHFKTNKEGGIDYESIEHKNNSQAENEKFEEFKNTFQECCDKCYHIKNTNENSYWEGVMKYLQDEIQKRESKLKEILSAVEKPTVQYSNQKKKTLCQKFLSFLGFYKSEAQPDSSNRKLENLLESLNEFGFDYKEKLLHITKSLHKDDKKVKDIPENGISELSAVGLEEINGILDITLRYQMFWLAVHYYEASWLMANDCLDERKYTYKYLSIQDKRFHRMAKITPCMVMTFFKLPDVFRGALDRTRNSNQSGKMKISKESDDLKQLPYMRNIDLLIVDEAGQVAPELAIPSFALAKKAIVVGDVHQIPPVYSVSEIVDYEMHKKILGKDSIENISEFLTLPLNCSSSSLMSLATSACKFQKKGERGMFLSEHRRCYKEIISFCNELVYHGRLNPRRPDEFENDRFLGPNCPVMGSFHVSHQNSEVDGESRICMQEAEAIAKWIDQNYEEIRNTYSKDGKFAIEKTISVITPFKAQVDKIKVALEEVSKKHKVGKIPCGTVHTFQGAESKIVIFSTVYGRQEGWKFIKENDNLINVAVSRAKDYFFTFGERSIGGCTDNEDDKDKNVAQLLLKYTKTEIPAQIIKVPL